MPARRAPANFAADPPTTPVQRFYRFQARFYDQTRWLFLHGRRAAVAALNLRPADEVLEIGCGTGLNFHHLLAWLAPNRGRLTGVDFSSDMLRRAARRIARAGWTNVTLVAADATQLALGRTFDAVFFGYSLTMIPDWRAALQRAWAHLRPGGRLVVLDFGDFHGWGPLAPLSRGWLRLNHVETLAPYAAELQRLAPGAMIRHLAGRYAFIAAAEAPVATSPPADPPTIPASL